MGRVIKSQPERTLRKRHSKYKGVYWHKRNHKWVAKITVDGKFIWLGYHESEIDAAKAFDRGVEEWREKSDKFLATNRMLGLLAESEEK